MICFCENIKNVRNKYKWTATPIPRISDRHGLKFFKFRCITQQIFMIILDFLLSNFFNNYIQYEKFKSKTL